MMTEPLRDPEAMLARFRTEEASSEDASLAAGPGRLKIFFGYAAGVGKTFTMLEAARAASAEGHEVVLGYIEPHGRPETESLMTGLEQIPRRAMEYRGVMLSEFALDAALARRPGLILIDELAHSNAPGCRHRKRWQDVQELLEGGIDVWTTLNVQHVESLNDTVAQIAGIQVRETVPDRIFDEADEVELVDLPPDELLNRLRAGKVYIPEQAAQAIDRFFRKANLVALREIALRRVADRVGREAEVARKGHTRTQVWPTRERLLVCVGPSPTSAKVIRTAKRMASAMDAEWIAVHAETATVHRMDAEDRKRLAMHLQLAAQLGAETVTISGADVAQELVDYALSRNVTKIVIGKTGRSGWYSVFRPTVVDRLLARSGDIDVYVIRGHGRAAATPSIPVRRPRAAGRYLKAVVVLSAATLVGLLFDRLGLTEPNLVMVYLLGVVLAATWLGRGPGILSAFLSVLLFNFFFTQPYYTFIVHDTEYVFTFAVMFGVATLISALTARVRAQAETARQRERRTEALYRLSRTLGSMSGTMQLAGATEELLATVFSGQAAVFLPSAEGLRAIMSHSAGAWDPNDEGHVAEWVHQHRRPAGRGTDTLPSASALHLPMIAGESCLGVVALKLVPRTSLDLEQRQLLEAFVNQVALAMERDRVAQEAQKVLAEAEAEKLRSSLLSAVSHDLRTPLAGIAGASSTLLSAGNIDTETRRDLLQSIWEESDRLSRLVENLLHMTRIESGTLKLHKEWQPIDEVIGSALHRLDTALADHPVETSIPQPLPMIAVDGLLIEQVLINLLDNAAKYSPSGTEVRVQVDFRPQEMIIKVIDAGPGLAPGEQQRVFEKFYRGSRHGDAGGGAGLGLAICNAVIQMHGGRMWAEPGKDGQGTCFAFTIPIEGEPPRVDDEATIAGEAAASPEHP